MKSTSALVHVLVLGLACVLTSAAHAELRNFSQVTPAIYRGGQPESAEDYQELKSHGIRTIINLRADDTVAEEAAIAQQLGMRFINNPLVPGQYPDEGVVNAAISELGDASLLPIFIHCEAGKARTGIVVGLARIRYQHWSAAQAYQEMKAHGFNFLHFALKRFFDDHAGGR